MDADEFADALSLDDPTTASAADTDAAAAAATPAPGKTRGRKAPAKPAARPSANGSKARKPTGATFNTSAAPSVVAIRRLLRHWFLVPLALLIGVAVGVISGYKVSLSPLTFTPRSTSYGFANNQLLIDSLKSRVGNANANLDGLAGRAEVFTSLLTSDQVRQKIAGRLRVPVEQVSARVIETGETIGDNSDAQDQLAAINTAKSPYQLTFQAERRGPNGSIGLPLITVTGQAPDVEKAKQLVTVTGQVASDYFTDRAATRGVKKSSAARVTAVGQPNGVQILTGASKAMALFAGVAVFVVLCGLILIFERFVQDWSVAGAEASGAKQRRAKA